MTLGSERSAPMVLGSPWRFLPYAQSRSCHPPSHEVAALVRDRKSTRLNSSHSSISYAVFCLKKKKNKHISCRQFKSAIALLFRYMRQNNPPPPLQRLSVYCVITDLTGHILQAPLNALLHSRR